MTEVILGRGNRLHAVECAIVRLALKIPAAPQHAALDLWDHAGQWPSAVVRLQRSARAEDHTGTQAAAENALARLVLAEPVAPEPTASTRNAALTVGAGARRSTLRGLQPQARFLTSILFGVRWCDADTHAHGAEQYRLAWLPMVDRWVVTASHTLAGRDGYKDRLLATTPHATDVLALASESVGRYWQSSRHERGLPRWTACTGSGRIENAVVQALADRVWPLADPAVRNPTATHLQAALETA